MTGYGEAKCEEGSFSVTVSVRSVNHRFFKSSIKLFDAPLALEPEVEKLVKRSIRRGYVNVAVTVLDAKQETRYDVDTCQLNKYRETLKQECGDTPSLESLLPLPGVVVDKKSDEAASEEKKALIRATLTEALDNHKAMRKIEGDAMAAEFRKDIALLTQCNEKVKALAPRAEEVYRKRLHAKLELLLAEYEVTLKPEQLIREVAILADKTDIAEETVRFESHLQQFLQIVAASDAECGKKLDFVIQEMNREVNTIGSKVLDLEISQDVVEMKAAIERIREMVQNVE